MERTEQSVRSFMVSEQAGIELDPLISDLASGKATMLHVVKSLGEYLTAEDEGLRSKAVGFLSTVLAQCPADKITKQSAHVLTVFLRDKLDDIETIIPALKGLVPLTSNPSFMPDDAVATIKAIFQHVTMKAHVQSSRLQVFTIVDNLLARHREAMIAMGDEFIQGYVEIAEGEKDPRNLLLAFSIARVVLIEFDISKYVDDLFNITFCYFPISFRPPPDDPYGISPEDLKHSLRSCLAATPRFGPLAMPLFLEKLSAGSGITKQDTLQTIASCLPVYGAVLARTHASKLWSAFKLEIFQPIDAETADCALETTQTLIRVIYPSVSNTDASGTLEGLPKHIVEECLEILKEIEKSKAKPAIRVLAALVATAPSITRYTVSQTVPHLIRLFRDPAEISNRPATLVALWTIVRSVQDLFTSGNKPDVPRTYENERPLDPFKDEVLGVFTVGLKASSSASPALMGLDAMVKIPGLLTNEELGFVVHSVNEVLTARDESSNDVRTTALNSLSAVSLVAPKHIEDTTLPLLFSSLPDTAPPREAVAEHAQYRRILSNLATLCAAPALFETLVIRLSTKLDLICASPIITSTDQEVNAAYANFILLSLSNVLARKVDAGHMDIPKYLDRLVPRLYNLFIHAAMTGEKAIVAAGVARHPRLIEAGSNVIKQILQTVPVKRQQAFAESLFAAYFKGQVHAIADGHQSLPSEVTFRPFGVEASPAQKALVPLFAAPVIAFHQEVLLPVEDEALFLSTLSDWILDVAENEVQALSMIHTVSSVLNKHTEVLVGFISIQPATFWRCNIADSTTSLDRRRRAVQTWTWLSKALVVRNHDLVTVYVDQLFSLFSDETLNWDAAKAVGIIGSGGEDILTKKNFAALRILSIQKFFNLVLPRIIGGVESNPADPTKQTSYLVALASLIKSIPKTVYSHEMPKLMPLLLRGLDLPDMDMRADVIETLHNAARDVAASGEVVQSAVSEHAPSLVAVMLKNGRMQEVSSSRLRKAALRYLGLLPQVVQYNILHPYKYQTIRDLGKCVDDPKRDVRKEAVDAR
ncbi:ARM repeat-containing protein [Ramaria rubella]|nr:ARM repeat-containing protein [Ramaria rubella]